MTAFEFMEYVNSRFPAWPFSPRNRLASKTEVRRWLNEGAIEINNTTPRANDTIAWPITSYVWFPKSSRKVTLW